MQVPARHGEVHRIQEDDRGGPGEGSSCHIQARAEQVEEDAQGVDGMQST